MMSHIWIVCTVGLWWEILMWNNSITIVATIIFIESEQGWDGKALRDQFGYIGKQFAQIGIMFIKLYVN